MKYRTIFILALALYCLLVLDVITTQTVMLKADLPGEKSR